ncbi:MAG TPA: patatin-like phospholipase family protein [Bryobacteraceae bacterium]|nr:patatin-like phospholipase family protein [Bryobacteraceae bacterium]
MSQKVLLSIDGGGIRGIIPALALQKLEQVTGRPAHETVSFVAGTSTGALMAAAVAAGLPAAQIVDIYKDRSKDIFVPRPPLSDIRRYSTGHKYDAAKLNQVLREEFGAKAGWTLNDSPIDLLLTATRLSDGRPWYFVKDNIYNAKTTGRFGLLDCTTASAAAPTYFDPWTIQGPPGKLVDGGIGVTGNPVYQACIEAFCYSPGYDPERTTVISFGTGRYISRADPHSILDWLNWVLDTLLHAPEDQQTKIVARHYPQTVFYRLEPQLDLNVDMDDVEHIPELERMGEEFAAEVNWEAMLRCDDTKFRMRPPKCPAAVAA